MKEMNILIVDDDIDYCDSLKCTLDDERFNIFSAGTCKAALKIADSKKAHVALLDLKLPDGSGTDLLAGLKQMNPDLICIMITAYAELDSAISSVDKGASHYLQKPFSPEKLHMLLDRTFEVVGLREAKQKDKQKLKARNLELEEINTRLQRIVESVKDLSSRSNLKEFGPLLLKEFAKNMAAEGGSLFLRQSHGLVMVHSLDPTHHTPATIPFPLKKGSAFERVISKGQPILIQDIEKERKVFSSGWQGYKDGSLLVFPLPDKTGEIVGVISLHNKIDPPFISQDLKLGKIMASFSSETLRATKAIEATLESEKKLRSVLDASPDPVIVFNVKGEVTYLNPIFTSIFGWAMDELKGRQIDDIFIPDKNLSEEKNINEKLMAGKRISGVETSRYTKKRNIIPVSISGSVYRDTDESIIGSVVNIRDITKQKTLEAQLAHAQKMEAIGTLAGGIAHDFNNILSAIVGSAEMAQFDISPKNPLQKKIKQILTASNRAKDLIRQILTFSRQTPQEQKPVQIDLIAKEALKLLRASLPSTIEIRQNIDIKSSAVLADPTRIHQVLMNLCTNAHHAMREKGGVLEVKMDNIKIDTHIADGYPGLNTGSYLRITVADTGCGIDQDHIKKIFDPYFTTKEKEEGTGLGLAVAHGVIKSYGGTITVESKPEKGTSFNVYLPMVEDSAITVTQDTKPLLRGNERILFVDDEEMLVEIGNQMLSRLGYNVVTKTSSNEALETFRAQPDIFDLVITDMTMPKMSGEVLAKEMMSIRADIPVIICTGFNELDVEKKAGAMGIKAFLIKPLAIRDLSYSIRKVLGK
jgi:PAS domain S-box-containing protein